MCAPNGAGFLYARREVQHLIEPLMVSWEWNRDEPDPKGLPNPSGLSRFVEENEWQGTCDPAAYLTVPADIRFQAEHDWPRVRAECHELLREARRRLEAYGRSMLRPYQPICPDSPDWCAQMAAFPLPACDGMALQRRLYGEYRVEVPVIDWGDRQFVRVSVQGYDTADDIDVFVRALRAILGKPPGRPAVCKPDRVHET